MHRKTVLTLVLALGLVLTLAPAALARKATVHFFVVTQSIDTAPLNAFLVKTAGGYTVSASQGGSKSAASRSLGSENWSYTVAADKNLSRELLDFLKTTYGLPGVFLLVWEAERPGL